MYKLDGEHLEFLWESLQTYLSSSAEELHPSFQEMGGSPVPSTLHGYTHEF